MAAKLRVWSLQSLRSIDHRPPEFITSNGKHKQSARPVIPHGARERSTGEAQRAVEESHRPRPVSAPTLTCCRNAEMVTVSRLAALREPAQAQPAPARPD